MTLGFKTHIKNKPTYFLEKILVGLVKNNIIPALNEYNTEAFHPKIHTIRADPKNRWKAGNKIHLVTGNRTKHRFQFAPVLECISTQDIEIKWTSSCHYKKVFQLFIDGEIYGDAFGTEEITDVSKAIYDLAINEGFDSLDDFFAWFNEDFIGKIIHWTDYHYS